VEMIEKFDQPPNADAVAVLTLPPIVRVGMRDPRRIRNAETFAVGEMLEVETDMDGEALSVGPCEIRPLDDGAVREAVV
jgi:hypothetical protein